MNDSQSTATGSQTTQNPQTPGGQNLADTGSNLQTSTPKLFTGDTSASITSVGDSSFTPYTPDNTTTATVTQTPTKSHKNVYPVIIASGLLIVVVLIVSWLMIRKQPSY